MSARRDVLFHLVLACAGLGLAAWATAEPDAARSDAGQVEVFDCGAATEVVFESAQRDVTLRRGGEGIWIEVVRRPREGEPVRRRFRGGEEAEGYLASVSPLDARRALGRLEGTALADVGLDGEPEATLAIACGDERHRFAVGGRAYGTGDRYVRAEDGRVYLLPARRLRDLDVAELRLMQHRLHRFPEAAAAAATVRAGERSWRLLHRNRRSAQAAWVAAERPEERRRDLAWLMRALWQLAVSEYLEAPPGELGEPVLEARWEGVGGEALGEVTLRRAGEGPSTRYLVRSEVTGGWAEVLPSAGAAVARALDALRGEDPDGER